MRGNALIEYMQLGIEFRLHECLVHYNRALTLLVTGNEEYGLSTLNKAVETIPNAPPSQDYEPKGTVVF